MTRLRRNAMVWSTLASIPAVSGAQSLAPNLPAQTLVPTSAATGTTAATTTAPVLAGVPAVDIITLKATGPATPLRFGNVIPGSERVQFNGEQLSLGTDYAIDNAAGVIYLLRAQKYGDSLVVNYQYDPKATATAGAPSSSLGMHYTFSPSINMFMGLGLAERAADGTVMTTNSMGWNNNFSMGSGKMSGLFVVGQKDKQMNQSGLQMDQTSKPAAGAAAPAAGESQFVVQQFRTSLLGGDVGLDYQDISKNFNSFSEVQAAGYNDAAVKALTGERGLQRMGYSLSGMKFGNMSLSSSFKNVKDGNSQLQWQTFGLTEGGLKFNYAARDLSQNFTRYKDLSDADKAQLQAESGLKRQSYSGTYAQKFGQLSFDDKSIKNDATGDSIDRKDFQFVRGTTKFDFGEQDVSKTFSRFGNLLADEKTTYGREAGLKRQWVSLDTAVYGKTNNLSFHELDLGGSTGQFHSDAMSYAAKSWSFQHIDMKTGATMSSLSALQDAEQDAHIQMIASMYGPGIKTTPGDRAMFQQGLGIERNFTSLSGQPYKNWNYSFTDLNLKGTQGDVDMQAGSIASKTLQVNYKHTDYGEKFNQVGSLLALEQQRVGSDIGLNRTDLGLAYNLSATSKLTASKLVADAPDGAVNRTTAEYADKHLDVQYSARDVTPGFQTTAPIVDSEAALLTTLRGYNEQDGHIKWQLGTTLKLDSQFSQAKNLTTGTLGDYESTVFDWTANKNTQIQFSRQDGHNSDPLNTAMDSLFQKASLTETLGKYGKVQLVDTEAQYGIPGSTLPDYHTQYVSYETKLTTSTSFKTEQSHTDYGNGGMEDINANTVSTTLNKRAGVSVTNMEITAHGETQQDETKRNYGFWYDIGNGLRISYGYARDLNGPTAGTLNTTFAVGTNADTTTNAQLGALKPGNAGPVSVAGGYGANQWDSATGPDRVQSFSNVGINTLKPVDFGYLKKITLKVSMDTAADYSAWLRENRLISVAGMAGPDAIGLDYRSQMQVNGDRAIDRGFHWASDQNPKDWIRASIAYKERTLPQNITYAIRDFSVTGKLAKKVELTNQLQTNPEVVRTDLILGSLPQASRSNKWKLDYLTDAKTTLGGSWEEMRNDTNSSISRTGGLNAKLFANSPSPVTLFFGLQQSDGIGLARRTIQRYSAQFDQKAGPTQSFNLFLGNLAYNNTLDPGQLKENWTARVNYQIRF